MFSDFETVLISWHCSKSSERCDSHEVVTATSDMTGIDYGIEEWGKIG